MTPVIALMALTALGLPGGPFHEPFHDPATASATQRYHVPSGLPQSERLTTAAHPAVCAYRSGPCAALLSARASARTPVADVRALRHPYIYALPCIY